MSRLTTARWAGFWAALRAAFGLVFVAASLDKIVHPQGFAQVVANYQILPDVLIHPLAIVLPWLEMVCGLALAVGVLARGAAVILGGLMALFTAVLGFNLCRGLDVNCGCFSVSAHEGNMASAMWRDLVLLAVGLAVLWAVFRGFVGRPSQNGLPSARDGAPDHEPSRKANDP